MVPTVAYGLPSFLDGRWWTLLTGPFLAIAPSAYVPMTGTFALFVGAAEWVFGTRRAAVVAVVTQLGGVLLSAGVLSALRDVSVWAGETASQLDVGFSAASLAAVSLVSTRFPPPWRLRIRLAVALYLVGSFVFLGSLADVEHLVAGGAVLLAAPWLDRRAGGPGAQQVRARERVGLGLATVVAATLLGLVLRSLLPTVGPVGDTGQAGGMWIGVAVVLLTAPVLAGVLRRTA